MYISEECISFGNEFSAVYGMIIDSILYVNTDYKVSDKLIILSS